MQARLRGAFATDSGMHALWDPIAFSNVCDYDTWEAELLENADIERHIRAGHFVPVYIHSDGVFEIEVRVGDWETPVMLSEREHTYLLAISEPYLFRSNGHLCVSGIEHIRAQPDEAVGALSVNSGYYSVVVHLIAWDDEPGMKDSQGHPSDEALPDFIMLLNPASLSSAFRSSVETFGQPIVEARVSHNALD